MSYKEYLASDWWESKKERFINSKTYRRGCLVCGEKRVDTHHLSYNVIGQEQPNKNLVFLCRKHHQEFHNWQKLNNKLVGDVPEWMERFHPIKWNKLKKHERGKMKKFTSKKQNGNKRQRLIKANQLLEVIKVNPNNEIFLNKKEWEVLFPLSNDMLRRLGLNSKYNDGFKVWLSLPINKQKLIDFLSNFDKYLIEREELKRQQNFRRMNDIIESSK